MDVPKLPPSTYSYIDSYLYRANEGMKSSDSSFLDRLDQSMDRRSAYRNDINSPTRDETIMFDRAGNSQDQGSQEPPPDRFKYVMSVDRIDPSSIITSAVSAKPKPISSSGSCLSTSSYSSVGVKKLKKDNSRKASNKRGNQSPLLKPQTDKQRGMKTLVLDLDETLVHSSFKKVKNADIKQPIDIDGFIQTIYVNIRPYTEEFIQTVSKYFEVVMFTASIQKYAQPIFNKLDREKKTSHMLFRDHCVVDPQTGFMVKDLSKLGRRLEDIIIIDNSPNSYYYQPENSLPSKTWIKDPQDYELKEMIPFLRKLSQPNVKDVRLYLNKVIDVSSGSKTPIFNKRKAGQLMKLMDGPQSEFVGLSKGLRPENSSLKLEIRKAQQQIAQKKEQLKQRREMEQEQDQEEEAQYCGYYLYKPLLPSQPPPGTQGQGVGSASNLPTPMVSIDANPDKKPPKTEVRGSEPAQSVALKSQKPESMSSLAKPKQMATSLQMKAMKNTSFFKNFKTQRPPKPSNQSSAASLPQAKPSEKGSSTSVGQHLQLHQQHSHLQQQQQLRHQPNHKYQPTAPTPQPSESLAKPKQPKLMGPRQQSGEAIIANGLEETFKTFGHKMNPKVLSSSSFLAAHDSVPSTTQNVDSSYMGFPQQISRNQMDQQQALMVQKSTSLHQPQGQPTGVAPAGEGTVPPPRDEFQKVNDHDITSITNYYYTKYRTKKRRKSSLNRELKKIEKEEQNLQGPTLNMRSSALQTLNTGSAVSSTKQGAVPPKIMGNDSVFRKTELEQKRKQILQKFTQVESSFVPGGPPPASQNKGETPKAQVGGKKVTYTQQLMHNKRLQLSNENYASVQSDKIIFTGSVKSNTKQQASTSNRYNSRGSYSNFPKERPSGTYLSLAQESYSAEPGYPGGSSGAQSLANSVTNSAIKNGYNTQVPQASRGKNQSYSQSAQPKQLRREDVSKFRKPQMNNFFDKAKQQKSISLQKEYNSMLASRGGGSKKELGFRRV